MTFISENTNLHTFDPGRFRERFPYFRRLMIASLSLVAIANQGCSMSGKLIEEHERICRQNMDVIVHDEELWREYRLASIEAHRQEILQTPPMAGRTFVDPVGDFSFWYGDDKTYFRARIKANEIVRDDVFLMKGGEIIDNGSRLKGGEIVAQFVDYIAYYKSIDGPTGFTCMNYYRQSLTVGDSKK